MKLQNLAKKCEHLQLEVSQGQAFMDLLKAKRDKKRQQQSSNQNGQTVSIPGAELKIILDVMGIEYIDGLSVKKLDAETIYIVRSPSFVSGVRG